MTIAGQAVQVRSAATARLAPNATITTPVTDQKSDTAKRNQRTLAPWSATMRAMSSDFMLGPSDAWIDVARALDRRGGEPRAAITLPEALHTLRVRCEPDRVIGYRAHDSLDVLVVELERLQAMEQRACRLAGMTSAELMADDAAGVMISPGHAARYILTGET
jgi:hypothetical protein